MRMGDACTGLGVYVMLFGLRVIHYLMMKAPSRFAAKFITVRVS